MNEKLKKEIMEDVVMTEGADLLKKEQEKKLELENKLKELEQEPIIELPKKATKEDYIKFINDQFNFAIGVIPDDKKQYWIKRIIESKSLTAKLELVTSIILHYFPK